MIIYIDADCKCHVTNDGSMTEVKSSFFDGKCSAFIEGYRFVPDGQTWTNANDITYAGEMIVPWKPFKELDDAQRAYERSQMTDMKNALDLLGVNVNG